MCGEPETYNLFFTNFTPATYYHNE
jgi:hypothetical protein